MITDRRQQIEAQSKGFAPIAFAPIAFAPAQDAEGIELESQLEELKALGCERGQGFLFSKALPAEEAGELLRKAID